MAGQVIELIRKQGAPGWARRPFTDGARRGDVVIAMKFGVGYDTSIPETQQLAQDQDGPTFRRDRGHGCSGHCSQQVRLAKSTDGGRSAPKLTDTPVDLAARSNILARPDITPKPIPTQNRNATLRSRWPNCGETGRPTSALT